MPLSVKNINEYFETLPEGGGFLTVTADGGELTATHVAPIGFLGIVGVEVSNIDDRRRGVGTQLLRQAVSYAFKNDVRVITSVIGSRLGIDLMQNFFGEQAVIIDNLGSYPEAGGADHFDADGNLVYDMPNLLPVRKPVTDSDATILPFSPDLGITPADIADAHLALRHWQEKIGQNRFSNIAESQVDIRKLVEYYQAAGGNFFVALKAGRLAGFIAIRNKGQGVGEVKRLSVLPNYQGQHIGSHLPATMIDWAAGNGYTELELKTGRQEKAMPIYRGLGFEITDYLPRHDDWAMQKDLV